MYCFCTPVSSAITFLSVQTEYTEIGPTCQVVASSRRSRDLTVNLSLQGRSGCGGESRNPLCCAQCAVYSLRDWKSTRVGDYAVGAWLAIYSEGIHSRRERV